jgi:hypothetical protein
MPWISWVFIVMGGLMVVSALVAAISLVRTSLSMTPAKARAMSERVDSDQYRDFARYLWRGRLVLRVAGVLPLLLVWVWRDWAECCLVVYPVLWASFYITFALLGRSVDALARRMEQLLRDDSAPS